MVFGRQCCRRHCSQGAEELITVPVDGLHNEQTIKALQIMLKTAGMPRVGPSDGRMGKRTVRALQTFLWSKSADPGPVDGWWGKRTIKGLQSWLAAGGYYQGPIHGADDKETFKALQLALNAFAEKPPEKMQMAVVVEAPVGEKVMGLSAESPPAVVVEAPAGEKAVLTAWAA